MSGRTVNPQVSGGDFMRLAESPSVVYYDDKHSLQPTANLVRAIDVSGRLWLSLEAAGGHGRTWHGRPLSCQATPGFDPRATFGIDPLV